MTALAVPGASAAGRVGHRRRVRNVAWWGLCGLGLSLVAGAVFWVVGAAIANAVPGWRWSVLTETTTGIGGGLANTIAGTAVLMVGVGIMAGLVGIGTGLYLAELAPPSRVVSLLRSASEVLSGVPSIVFGYAGYVALCVGLHWGFSLLAALIVLSVLVVPYVAKSTEIALNQVPLAYREGGEALGMAPTYQLRTIVMRAAAPGIVTGVLVALAISVGETAPLLYTAGFSNSYPSAHLTGVPVPYLTYATFTFWDQPTTTLHALAFDSAVLLIALVLLLVGAARLIVRLTQRHAPGDHHGLARHRRRAPTLR